jgi:hypothetical protein
MQLVRKSVLSRLMLAGAVALAAVAGAPAQAGSRACCLTNQAYTGVCKVTPEMGEDCTKVLEYLNTVNTTGRELCNHSEIRGGWALVKCSEAGKTSSGSEPAAGQRTSPMNENAGRSKRTPTPGADGAATTPAPTPAPTPGK